MAAFQDLDDSSKPFLSVDQGAVDLLESISAVDKAQSVPLVRIWQVDPKTGDPVRGKDGEPSGPLTIQSVEPPSFGQSADSDSVRYRERPPVSLEQIVIKNNAPRGIILYRTLSISFIIHRPDVLFAPEDPDRDSWSQVILPGNVFAMEFGWRASSGVKNEILNGQGYVNQNSNPPIVVPGVGRIRFMVTNYSFTITPENEFRVMVTAYEAGEFNLRRAELGALSAKQRIDESGNRISITPATDPYAEAGKNLIASIQKQLGDDLRGKVDGKGMVRFGDLCDSLFADVITDAFLELGYEAPTLWLGTFNERAGKTSKKYGAGDYSASPISEFLLPFREVEKTFANLVKVGETLTLHNFIRPFLNIVQDPRNWDRKLAKVDVDNSQVQTLPQLMLRTITNKKSVSFYIFDVEREFTKFAPSDRFTKDELFGGDYTRERVRQVLADKGIPIISFQRGNSYISDSNFEVVNDDQVKSILMRRYLSPDREQFQDVSQKLKDNTAVDPRQILYSSAIHGEITMIGSFVFDVFGLVWLEFGVPVWDGPFYVVSHEMMLDPSGFWLKIGFISAGSDPLGTQGRSPPVTGTPT